MLFLALEVPCIGIQKTFYHPQHHLQPCSLYQSAQVAMTKYHRLGDLTNRHLFSHSSKGWKFKIKVSVLVSDETALPGVQRAAFLVDLTWSFLCACVS